MTAVAKARTGAAYARGQSKQVYATPRIFLEAVKAKFKIERGQFDWDLAATEDNKVVPDGCYYGPDQDTPALQDAFANDWSQLCGHVWLNPPYDTIAPWAQKCATNRGPEAVIYFLVPAAVGSNWWAKYVHKKARVDFLNGRLSFDGLHPYPKDSALCTYGLRPGYHCWRWKNA